MERIRIKINRLGRIRNSEVSFSQMVIFSGESGLGKSYLALLCHYFFEVLINTKRFENFFKTNNIIYDRTVLRNQGIATTIYKKDLEVWLAEDALAYIGYMLNHNVDGDIEVKLPEAFPEMIEIKFEEQMMGLVDNEDTYIVLKTEHLTYKIKDNTSFEELPYAFLLRHELINILFGNFKALKNTFVLPPSRGPLLTENIIPVTGLYKEYKNALDELNSANNIQEESDDYLLSLINDILEGNVTVNDNKYIYYMNDGGPLPISAAAASVKEIVPLELIAEKTNVANDAILIEERLMEAGTALASSGIAFALRYIRAAIEGGVELGFYPKQAQEIVVHTVKGAIDLLLENKSNPEAEIDKVTTPGGITIKGLNEMELSGFTSAVIRGLKASR